MRATFPARLPPAFSTTLPALAALLVLAFAFQGSRGLFAPDEGYYVVIAKSMVETGDYLVPRLEGSPWLDKPPLSLWGIAAGLSLLGQNEWGARVFHGLCYVLTTLLVCSLGRRFEGKRGGIMAGVVYATMAMPFVAANVITPDTPLTLATTAVCYCFWRSIGTQGWRADSWKILMSIAFGAAFLTKGPAALIPGAAILAFLVVRRQVRAWFLGVWTLAGLVGFCLFGLGWYALMALELPTALEFFWRNQVVGRTISSEFNRNPGLPGAVVYLPVLLLGTLPWSVFWWPALWRAGRRISGSSLWRRMSDDPIGLFLAAWIAVPLLVLTLASSKLPLYALPVFPAMALMTSRCVLRTSRSPGRGIVLLILWGLALVGLKGVAAIYPSGKDMRALHVTMEDHLPEGKEFEIVSVGEHIEGLSFYDDHLVEYVTTRDVSHRFLVPAEPLDEEIDDIATSDYSHVFVSRNEARARRVRDRLNRAGVTFEEVSLPFRYDMFVCEPSQKAGAAPRSESGG